MPGLKNNGFIGAGIVKGVMASFLSGLWTVYGVLVIDSVAKNYRVDD